MIGFNDFYNLMIFKYEASDSSIPHQTNSPTKACMFFIFLNELI